MIQEAKEILETLEDKQRRIHKGSDVFIALMDLYLIYPYRKPGDYKGIIRLLDEVTKLKIEELLPETIHRQLTEGIVASVHIPTFLASLRKEFGINSQEAPKKPLFKQPLLKYVNEGSYTPPSRVPIVPPEDEDEKDIFAKAEAKGLLPDGARDTSLFPPNKHFPCDDPNPLSYS